MPDFRFLNGSLLRSEKATDEFDIQWYASIFLNQTNRNASKLLCKFSLLQHANQ